MTINMMQQPSTSTPRRRGCWPYHHACLARWLAGSDPPPLCCSFLYTKGLEDLVVGRKKRKWFQHGELGLGKYAKGERGRHIMPL